MNKKAIALIIGVIGICLLSAGTYVMFSTPNRSPESTVSSSYSATSETNVNESTQIDSNNKAPLETSILAGKNSVYREFNQEDYESALKTGKIIFLDFYANWCPICRAEAPHIHSGFDELTSDKVVGFRVNYKDDQTNKDEDALAKEFKILYQHTKVILKDGKEVLRSGESWDKETFLKEVNKLIGE
jgi:thioredoxin 1